MELRDNITIEQVKTGLQTYLEMNKAAVLFSQKAIQGSFLLNGGAATAILASKSMDFVGFACSFGFGAFLAVCAMAAAYATNLAVAETWECHLIEKTPEEHATSFKKFQHWLLVSVAIGIASGVWFLVSLAAIFIALP